ncbi:ABC transporter permease [Nocardioides cavernae]|uniref:Autoinducer 2 import system permease protein LsrC n=1 Tax=Nocardioides cavernae TaxID=1921566 RepID=A0ABR8N7Y3_9ACTN|nr:ABC transporter permease [Nocardioides cavernae]MBD3924257.1 ABC transporter permease [Nocardioides cavernae]MBM7510804.1 ribose transport system permease protein [Nocardioides cavernae]
MSIDTDPRPAMTPRTRGRGSLLVRVLRHPSGGVLVALVVLCAVCLLVAPGTLRLSSLHAMLPLAGALAIAAAGQTLVIQQRGFDISVPATMTLSAYVCFRSIGEGRSVLMTVFLCLATVVVIGFVNALLITRLAITPLIATLATNALVTGAVWVLSDGSTTESPAGLVEFIRLRPLGIPAVAAIAVVVVLALQFFLSRTTAGQSFLVAGASPSAARVVGIDPRWTATTAYLVSAGCAGLSGILLGAYATSANNTLGDSYLLPAVAAVIVGGTPLKGGAGSVLASGLAALFLTQLVQLTLSVGAPTSSQLLVQSGAIVAAVCLRALVRDRSQPLE